MMKRTLCFFLLCSMLLCSGCKKASPAPSEPSETSTSTTLMIYMVGSDLESKSGAGTDDLLEMEESGVDLNRNNIVVYASGTPYWHNDVMAEKKASVLQLTADGFVSVKDMEEKSMGDAQTLADFINYTYENYPAEHYALILWDHGNGPILGYGKDMLFGKDSLTLQEIRSAMEQTPFCGETKLDWVGFDACLMASAELACIWADHANYLVASQEVEPAFGWSYEFLSQLSMQDTPTLLDTIATGYLDTCLEYYERKGYSARDTTLSCMDLSYAPQLEASIEALFSEASADVSLKYNTLAASRARTRALGRASTGSEYDLIDLQDMADQLSSVYPDQTQAVTDALSNMILKNATNASGCCGLSLYYPYHNKYHFEDSWSEVYTELGLFPSFHDSLSGYETFWLQTELSEAASSVMPDKAADQVYTLQLTPEQAKSYASSRYYILREEGTGLYSKLYSSENITNEDGLLTANFDGNIIYVKNKFNEYATVPIIEHDTVDQTTRYSVNVNLDNYSPNAPLEIMPDGYELPAAIVDFFRFHLLLDHDKKEVSVSALVPHDYELPPETIFGGKTEDPDLSKYNLYFFLNERHRFLTRDANGTILPYDSWPDNGWFTGYSYPIDDGLEFEFAPLDSGEYFLLFEVEDTSANRYCSELLPITIEEPFDPEPIIAEPVSMEWNSGEKAKLYEQDGVTVYLKKQTSSWDGDDYVLELVNNTDRYVQATTAQVICNDTIYVCEYGCGVAANPNSTAEGIGSLFGFEKDDLAGISSVKDLCFNLTVSDFITDETLLRSQQCSISLSGHASISLPDLKEPFPVLDASATEQTIFENDEIRLDLISLGGSYEGSSSLSGTVRITNKTDRTTFFQLSGIVFNDSTFVPVSSNQHNLPSGLSAYDTFLLRIDDLQAGDISSIGSVELIYSVGQAHKFFGGHNSTIRCSVSLACKGTSPQLQEGTQILYNENGIRITLKSSENNGSTMSWCLTVVNDSEYDICVDVADADLNAKGIDPNGVSASIPDGQIPAHRRALLTLNYYGEYSVPLSSLEFQFRILDFHEEIVLFEGSKRVTLTK